MPASGWPRFSNVRVTDFREVKEITHDLGKLCDVIHIAGEIEGPSRGER